VSRNTLLFVTLPLALTVKKIKHISHVSFFV